MSAKGRLQYNMTNDYMFRIVLQKDRETLIGLICSVLHLSRDEVIAWAKEKARIMHDIRSALGSDTVLKYALAASINEDWFVNHKVAKFVVNAVRMFEFFGYDWKLPLWDDELISLWYSVPLVYRGIHKNLYADLLFKDYFIKNRVAFYKPELTQVNILTKILPAPVKKVIKSLDEYLNYTSGSHIIPTDDFNNFMIINRYFYKNLNDRKMLNYGQLNGNALVARRVIEKIETNNIQNTL